MTMVTETPRVALVTGAGRGIGEAIAVALARVGHSVAVCDIDQGSAESVALAIVGEHGEGRAIGVGIDVTDAVSVRSAFAQVAERLGAVSILVNNAGVISVAPVVSLAESEWDRIMAVNAKGPFLCSREALPFMVQQGWGRIVNIASDAAKTAEPYIAHYSASKFAVVGLTQSIALEHAADGITANAICPAITDTAMMTQLAEQMSAADPAGGDPAAWRREFVREIPMMRPMATHDMAATCLFLVSEAAQAISGQALNVSGAHEVH
ncbi:MAG: SDR family NAD(P)-dependent oxidoreductase [Actinomycetota bacterium]|nr:SDR family NAD(P)-dependent oxidoreductase [Actinomycetota bacterium]